MSNRYFILYIIILFFIIRLITGNKCTSCAISESLVAQPNGAEKEKMIDDIIKYSFMFKQNISISNMRFVMPWMDAVLLEDIRRLLKNKQFDRAHIATCL